MDQRSKHVATAGRRFCLDKSKMLKSISPIHRVHFLRTAWFRVAVAILIILGIGTYLWNQNISRH